jgi:hypothetical protein
LSRGWLGSENFDSTERAREQRARHLGDVQPAQAGLLFEKMSVAHAPEHCRVVVHQSVFEAAAALSCHKDAALGVYDAGSDKPARDR